MGYLINRGTIIDVICISCYLNQYLAFKYMSLAEFVLLIKNINTQRWINKGQMFPTIKTIPLENYPNNVKQVCFRYVTYHFCEESFLRQLYHDLPNTLYNKQSIL